MRTRDAGGVRKSPTGWRLRATESWAEPQPPPRDLRAREGETAASRGTLPAAGFRPARLRSKPRDESGKRLNEAARPRHPEARDPARRAARTLPSSRLRPSQSNSISVHVPEPGSVFQPAELLPCPPLDGGRPGPSLPSGPMPRPFSSWKVRPRPTPRLSCGLAAARLSSGGRTSAPARTLSAVGKTLAPRGHDQACWKETWGHL